MSARAVATLRPRAGQPQWLTTALLCAWCALCILFAQTLGHAHGIAHGQVYAVGSAQAELPAQTTVEGTGDPHPASSPPDQGATQAAPNPLEALFAQHEDAGECRLFDALGHQPGAVMAGPVYLPAAPPCTQQLRRMEGAFVARWATLFDARAPPLSH